MWNYENIKKWFQRHKPTMVLVTCFILVFLSGFGAGRFDKYRNSRQKTTETNYTTNLKETQKAQIKPAMADEVNGGLEPATTTSPVSTAECKIKGNISSGNKKIYHVPGGASYKITKPEQCFNTEAEAVAAGFVKSAR